MDLESVSADLSAAATMAQTNRAKIDQSREVLKQAAATVERLQQNGIGDLSDSGSQEARAS
jgi:hypothetical protein